MLNLLKPFCMIVTITINPAVDKSSSTEKLMPEKKLRCTDMVTEAGGGGINVSKAINKLGGESFAIFPAGGINGQVLENAFREHGIAYKAIPVETETRENIVIVETGSNSQYRFVMPGGELKPDIIDTIEKTLNTLPEKPSIIVASGSLSPGLPDDFYAKIAAFAKKLGAKCIVDTSGKPLELAMQSGVYLMKPNVNELARLAGKDELQLYEVDNAAMELINKKACEVIVVSLGAAGALIVTAEGVDHVPAPTVRKKSTVGAGDSMVAGMVWMLEQGKSIKEMVRFGVACGTAATMNPGTELFRKEDAMRLYQWINEYGERHKINVEKL